MAVSPSSPLSLLFTSPFSFLPTLASGTSSWPFAPLSPLSPLWPLSASSREDASPPAALSQAASAVTSAVSRAFGSAQTAPAVAQPLYDYVYDAWQRSVLFLDALRERGNQTYVHEQAGMPPVLAFDYDVIVDGRELEDPCNYALLRIKPAEDAPTDPRMRPFVVIDPRAGHGPGIAGFKMDSEVGIALRKGHPCYFVTFFPVPCETQTIQSVAQAEAVFIQRVRELHPESDGLPFIIGNARVAGPRRCSRLPRPGWSAR